MSTLGCGSNRKRSLTLTYGSPEPPQHSGDQATAPPFGVSAYESWSPAASWQAAEERRRGASRRIPRLSQGTREPTIRLPALSGRALRYLAFGVVLVVAAVLAVRAFHALSNRINGTAATGHQRIEAKTFAWVPVPRARAYVVKFTLHGRVIYASRTRQPRLRLAARWRHNGRRYALYPGVYQWFVWPVFRTAKGSHRGPASVRSTLTIPG